MAYALVAAFPPRLVGDVQSVLAVMPEARLAPMMSFEVEVSANTCWGSSKQSARGLPGLAVPGSAQRHLFREFIVRNPAFCARTERCVVSYWSCYYRWKYGAFGTYPGCVLLEALRAAAVEQVGAQWPRYTPRLAGGHGEGPAFGFADASSRLITTPNALVGDSWHTPPGASVADLGFRACMAPGREGWGIARAPEEELPAVQAQAKFCQGVDVVVDDKDAGYVVGVVFGDLSAGAAEAESGRTIGFTRDDACLDQTPSVPHPVRDLPEKVEDPCVEGPCGVRACPQQQAEEAEAAGRHPDTP